MQGEKKIRAEKELGTGKKVGRRVRVLRTRVRHLWQRKSTDKNYHKKSPIDAPWKAVLRIWR